MLKFLRAITFYDHNRADGLEPWTRDLTPANRTHIPIFDRPFGCPPDVELHFEDEQRTAP